MGKILFVDDDREYQTVLVDILKEQGHEVSATSSPMQAMEIFTLNRNFDLIISDLKMDELDGIKFLTYVKKVDPSKKTMILTGEPSMDSESASLDILVDKYISKDIRLDVFVKHVEVLLAQQESETFQESSIISQKEDIILDIKGIKVTKKGEEIPLTLKEFNVLKKLLEKKGIAISREEMIGELWEEKYEVVDERIVDAYIKELRKKLRTQCLITIRGYGYKWDEK